MANYILTFFIYYFIVLDNWSMTKHPFEKLEYGKWKLEIPPDKDGSCPIAHNSNVKVSICFFFVKTLIVNVKCILEIISNYYLFYTILVIKINLIPFLSL